MKLGTKALTSGTDYTVVYTNNVNAGTATVTVTGKGNYTGTAKGTFTISAASLASATVTLSPTSYNYDGTAKYPAVTVKLGGTKTLTKDTDYTVSYANNVNGGTATVTVTGKGNYKESAKGTFTIVNKCGENVTWSLSADGVLTISGTGPMQDYTLDDPAPWYDQSDSIKTVVIESGVTTVGAFAFCGCGALTSVTIPAGVTSIGQGAFISCNSLPSVTLPDGLKTIGSSAFCPCSKLKSINIPSSVTSIGEYAFAHCKKLKGDIVIPSGVTSIGDYTFWETAITSVTIPSSVKTIGQGAFAACGSLKDITFEGSAPTIKKFAFDEVSATVHYPAGDKSWTGTVRKKFGTDTTWSETVSLASATLKLSKTKYTYNGKAKKPTVTVTLNGKTLKKNTDYTVKYTNNKKVGKATVTITGKGNYTGTKTATFKIIPKAPTLSSVKNTASKKITVKWTKVSGVTGYQIQYATNKNFNSAKTVKVKGAKNVSKAITKLTVNKTYYVRVRAYKTVSGTNYYSAWSAKKSVKIKK